MYTPAVALCQGESMVITVKTITIEQCRGDRGWLTQVMVDTTQISLEIRVLKRVKLDKDGVWYTMDTFSDIKCLPHQ